ncbi:MAG: hypothetical protein AAF921_18650 [Cyanobacteria bacterium P01_D01_bin.44]
MLDRLVRPLVRTQIQLLTQTQSASARLVNMVSQWLGYLGIQANVTQLTTRNGQVQISLAVGRPDQCSETEWQQILANINQQTDAQDEADILTYANMPRSQQVKVHRLLAHIIHVGNPEAEVVWDELQPRLKKIGLEDSMLLEIKSAIKVPAMLDTLLDDLEAEVAAFVLSRAISIALIDREINQGEDNALKAIYSVLEGKAKVSDI